MDLGAVWDLFWEGFGALLASLGSLLAMFLMSVCQFLALGAGFGLILVIFSGFWGLFFVFLGGCRGGKNSVSSRRNACFCIFALQIQVAKNLTKKRTSPC
jgi:hypothetical protein